MPIEAFILSRLAALPDYHAPIGQEITVAGIGITTSIGPGQRADTKS